MKLEEIRERISAEEAAKNLQYYFNKISSHYGNYEERASQKSMIWSIVKAFEMGEHAIIEAPTGTGKSLAYLLAFLSVWDQFEDKQNQEGEITERKPKLCIATNTIALQEQLMAKDIPFFKDIIGSNFKAALIKGRNNYVCEKNLSAIVKNPEKGLFTSLEETNQYNVMVEDILDSKGKIVKGERSDLSEVVTDELWRKVSIDSANCTKKSCEFYETCPFYKAKKENAKADVLVTNHSMFFADLKVKMETNFDIPDLVLPNFDYVVFDEAHNLEDVAAGFLGATLSRSLFRRLTGDIKNKLTTDEKVAEDFDKDPILKQDILGQLQVIDNHVENFFIEIVREATNQTEKGKERSTTRRLFQPIEDLKRIEHHLSGELKSLNKQLESAIEALDIEGSENADTIRNFADRATVLVGKLNTFCYHKEAETVYWIEAPDRGKRLDDRHHYAKCCYSPISVGPTLAKNMFDMLQNVVLTSATLGSDDLQYVASRLGIERYIGKMYHSPFDYKEQSALYVPAKTVNPKSNEFNDYAEKEIKELIKMSKGRTLVLFTSYFMLNSMSDKLSEYITKELGYTFLKQGDMQRTPLIDKFRSDTHSVLFATSSYWEGIDVQGDSLSSVIITKLPFDVPDQPIIQARMDDINNKGGNAFADYQVPMAIMKFKQGFGRLIRSTTDKGVVTVLDERIIKMGYGKRFLRSLPPINIIRQKEELTKYFN